MKSKQRFDAFSRLKEKGDVIKVEVEKIKRHLYIRKEEVALLHEVLEKK